MKMCQACHAQVAEGWPAGAHGKGLSDPALAEGMFGCESCHGPGSIHVGSTGKQPIPVTGHDQAALEAACAKCHLRPDDATLPATWPNLNQRYWRRTLHARKDTSCLKCHKIHGGVERAQSQPAGALCLSCHKAVINPEAGGFTHTPVANGQCLLCHTPHGGQARHNLVDKLGAACQTCHPVDETLRKAHGAYAVDQADCTSCHNPHSFDRARKLLKKTEHPPFRKCEVCHVASQGANRPGLVKPQKQLCLTCHAASKITPVKSADGKPMKVHVPAQQGLCTSCHNPHASDQAKLVKDAPLANTCFLCHGKIEDATLRPHEHKPVATGNCLLCHQPHASVNDRLLTKGPLVQCQPCHGTQMKFSHPVGMRGDKPVIDPTTKKMLTCARCHAIHGSTVPSLLPMEMDDLCRTCHNK